MQKKLKQNQGFSMLEMMIALLVLSIGLIGLASLQARGQQFNHAAYVRTQAAFLAYDIMDRMRSNSDSLSDNGNADDGGYVLKKGECPDTLDCGGESCTPTDMVRYDLAQWCNSLASTLPLGQGEIKWNKTDGLYTVDIYWVEDRDEDAKMKQQSWNMAL